MAAARVAMPSRSGSHITSRHQSPQPLGVRRPSPSSSSHATRSSSMAPTGLFRRRLLFLLNQESAPDFPFCEAAYEARSRIRWPPWPHRLDPGHRKVKEKKTLSHHQAVAYLFTQLVTIYHVQLSTHL